MRVPGMEIPTMTTTTMRPKPNTARPVEDEDMSTVVEYTTEVLLGVAEKMTELARTSLDRDAVTAQLPDVIASLRERLVALDALNDSLRTRDTYPTMPPSATLDVRALVGATWGEICEVPANRDKLCAHCKQGLGRHRNSDGLCPSAGFWEHSPGTHFFPRTT